MTRLFLLTLLLCFPSLSNAAASKILYDPFDLQIVTPERAYELASLVVINSEGKGTTVVQFAQTFASFVNGIIGTARKANLRIMTDAVFPFSGLASVEMITAAIVVSTVPCEDDWLEFNYNRIVFKNGGILSKPRIGYLIGSDEREIVIYNQTVEEYIATAIDKAKLEKRKVRINSTALKSKLRQQYLRGAQLLALSDSP